VSSINLSIVKRENHQEGHAKGIISIMNKAVVSLANLGLPVMSWVSCKTSEMEHFDDTTEDHAI